MFQKNDYVVYANEGVCLVQKIDYPAFLKQEKKQYYVLKPLHSPCDHIFVPVDSAAKMRKVLSRTEAESLIESIPKIDSDWLEKEGVTEETYKKILHSYDCYELVKMVIGLNSKISVRKKDGKKPLRVDEKYMNMAEACLHGELSVALDIPVESVATYIEEKVGAKAG